MKELLVLVMSVGKYDSNGTVDYLEEIGGSENIIVCLPEQFSENAESYESHGIKTFIYDEKKYINDSFEFFGFKPRNCGGVGRQGIAEAVEKFADDGTIILELDDDSAQMFVRRMNDDGTYKSAKIRDWDSLVSLVNVESQFFDNCGIEVACQTGASVPKDTFITNRKIFNNFIMHKGNPWNFKGFAALCSDDYRFNLLNNLMNCRPMLSHSYGGITFRQNQGDRKDGNAPLYNSDYSWKKSYSLRMMAPWATEQRFVREANRKLFRENFKSTSLFPPICLENEKGDIVGRII